MATPLSGEGYSVNLVATQALVELLLGAGVRGLFVGGTTGEGILLTLEQRMVLHEIVMKQVDGRAPVILHVGANTTVDSVALAEHALSLEATAIAAVTPFFYPLDKPSLLAYYQELATAAPTLPLLAYDIPHLAVSAVQPEWLQEMATRIPTFAGLKTSRPDAQVVRQIVAQSRPTDVVLAGNERIALGLLALGADGLISGLATAVPEPFVALLEAFNRRDRERAQLCQQVINGILDLIPAGRRIGAIKSILEQRGIAAGRPVPPRQLPDDPAQLWNRIQRHLEALNAEETQGVVVE